jgi:NitT/TauT family transport system substrate-binding protein
MNLIRLLGVLYATLIAILIPLAAHAEVPEVRIARQFSMGYLQLNMMEHEKLIQKHAAMLGIPEVKVTGYKFNGPSAMNDALLSDSLDIVTGSPMALYFIWGRTRGTPQEVRGISAMVSMTLQILSRDPAIATIADLDKCGKIAVAAVKISAPSLLIQAAAAKAFGPKDYARFDPLTVSMTPPDAMASLLSGSGEIGCTYAVQPYMAQMLAKPGIHTVLDAHQVWGPGSTFTVAYTSKRFHDRDPRLYRAVYDAMAEATDMINADLGKASRYWIEDGESKLSEEFVKSVAGGPDVTWTMTPRNTLAVAQFMHDVGTLKVLPDSWKDYFFPEAYGLRGN